MNVESEAGGDNQLVCHVVTLTGVLQFLAAPAAHGRNHRQLAALSRESNALRALVDSRADGDELRAQALHAIGLAEKAVNELMREAISENNTPQPSKRGMGRIIGRLSGKQAPDSREDPAESAETLERIHRSGGRLLETLGQLHAQLACKQPLAAAAPVAAAASAEHRPPRRKAPARVTHG
jgi:hypothetical protein